MNAPQPRRATPLHHHAMRILLPPLAHLHHGRYRGYPLHLVADTILSSCIIVLLGVIGWLWLRPVPATPLMTVAIEAPESVLTGSNTTLTVTVQNSSSDALTRVVLSLDLPEGITTTATEPVLATPTIRRWDFGNLERGESRVVRVEARVVAAPPSTLAIRAVALGEQRASSVAAGEREDVHVLGGVSLTLTAQDDAVAQRESPVSVTVTNERLDALEGLALSFDAGDSVLALSAPGGGEGTLLAVPRLEPAESWTGSVNVTAKTQAAGSSPVRATLTLGEERLRLADAEAVVTWIAAPDAPSLAGTPPTALTLIAEARRESDAGVSFGYGPIPPVVGQTTAYRVFWFVRAGESSASAVTLTASLPEGVQWLGNESATTGSAPSFSESVHTVTWSAGTIDVAQGLVSASFEVSMTPRARQVGQRVRLLGPTILTAMVSDESVHLEAVPVTTELRGQPGSGVVGE